MKQKNEWLNKDSDDNRQQIDIGNLDNAFLIVNQSIKHTENEIQRAQKRISNGFRFILFSILGGIFGLIGLVGNMQLFLGIAVGLLIAAFLFLIYTISA